MIQFTKLKHWRGYPVWVNAGLVIGITEAEMPEGDPPCVTLHMAQGGRPLTVAGAAEDVAAKLSTGHGLAQEG